MTDTAEEQLLAALATALEGIDAAPTVERHEDRVAEIETTDCPLLLVESLGSAPDTLFTGEDGYRLVVQIHAAATGDDGASARTALATLLGQVRRLLAQPNPLPGKARMVEPSPDEPGGAPSAPGADNIRTGALAYDLAFATPEGDPFTFV